MWFFLRHRLFSKTNWFWGYRFVFHCFPLFAYYRWKDKDIRDYMLTQENLDKMKENQKEEAN